MWYDVCSYDAHMFKELSIYSALNSSNADERHLEINNVVNIREEIC